MIKAISKAYIDHWKLNNNGLTLKSSTWQMIKNRLEVRIANDGENGNGLRYRFLKMRQDVSFSKIQFSWLEKR